MGAADSKLAFKKGVFRLYEDGAISSSDPFWHQFWQLLDSADDIFSLLTPIDIHRVVHDTPGNLLTLVVLLIDRLYCLQNDPCSFTQDPQTSKEALNCIRLLTRVLPYIYEDPSLHNRLEYYFWRIEWDRLRALISSPTAWLEHISSCPPSDTPPLVSQPLGEVFVSLIVDLLFLPGFTVPASVAKNVAVTDSQIPRSNMKTTFAIWETGVGSTTPIGTSKELDVTKAEVIRLLITLTSSAMYMTTPQLLKSGVKFLTYLVSCPRRQATLSLLCSLINTIIKYSQSWRVPYDPLGLAENYRKGLTSYCLDLLLILLVYHIPENDPDAYIPFWANTINRSNGKPPVRLRNMYRYYLSRLHRQQDLQFLADGLLKMLNRPIQLSASYIPVGGSGQQSEWSVELLSLSWELMQCNPHFTSYIACSNRVQDFLVLVLFYCAVGDDIVSKRGLVALCIYLLQTMTATVINNPICSRRLQAHNTLPMAVKLNNFSGSIGDFLILHIYRLLTCGRSSLVVLYYPLLCSILNIAPYIRNISYQASKRLVQLFVSMSSNSFLFANESNHYLLELVLRSINTIFESNFAQNPYLAYAVYEKRDRFYAIRDMGPLISALDFEPLSPKDIAEQLSSSGSVGNKSSAVSSLSVSLATTPLPSDDKQLSADRPKLSVNEGSAAATETNTSSSSSSNNSETNKIKPPSVPVAVSAPRTASTSPPPVRLKGRPHLSKEYIEDWLSSLPLDTSFKVIEAIDKTLFKRESKSPMVPPSSQQPSAISTTSNSSNSGGRSHSPISRSSSSIGMPVPDVEVHEYVSRIRRIQIPGLTSTSGFHTSKSQDQVEEPPIYKFEWSPESLGWYSSLLWGLVFEKEMKPGTNGLALGIWNGTHIKLFKVKLRPRDQAPSLFAQPVGAVDAVAANVISKFGNLGLSSNAQHDNNNNSNNSNNNTDTSR